MYFFFSSRRRHTRWTGDWSSDVCSSDLGVVNLLVSLRDLVRRKRRAAARAVRDDLVDRKSVVSGKSVDLGGRRILKKKKESAGPGACIGSSSDNLGLRVSH